MLSQEINHFPFMAVEVFGCWDLSTCPSMTVWQYRGKKDISAQTTWVCLACQNINHIFKSLSNDCCISSVLPASGFGVQEQSQESQETMIGNWSATLNELGFKEVFIHPQRIHPAESDWFYQGSNGQRCDCNGWEKERVTVMAGKGTAQTKITLLGNKNAGMIFRP